MDDIDTLASSKTMLKIVFICLQVCLNIAKLVMISANYHDIARLLFLTTVKASYMISIIRKENITISRQNHLVAHPWLLSIDCVTIPYYVLLFIRLIFHEMVRKFFMIII